MERVSSWSGANADSLPPPDGVDRSAILRALDRERLAELAPDLPRARIARIARLREDLRHGRLETPERLETALRRALADAARPRPRS
jgi:hypothetical protein